MSQASARYAKSLIEISQEHNALENVSADMELFRKVCKENRGLELLLRNPIINHEKKLNVLKALFENKVQKLTMAIFTIITKKNREAILHNIAVDFQTQYNIIKGINKVSIVTASSLVENQRKIITTLVEQATKKQVELVEKIDENIIGGFILKLGDKQIDASVKTKLNKIKKTFSDKTYISKI